jgi:hypothetical protein
MELLLFEEQATWSAAAAAGRLTTDAQRNMPCRPWCSSVNLLLICAWRLTKFNTKSNFALV